MAKMTTVSADAEAFSARYKEAIRESDIANLKPTEQAKELGVSKSLHSQWMSGRTAKPQTKTLRKPCKRLGVNVDWLLDNIEPKRGGQSVEQQGESEDQPKEPGGVKQMNLRQQQEAMNKIMENIPQTARDEFLYGIVRKALDEKWMDHVPDEMMALWSAKEQIDKLKSDSKKPPKGTQ